jgi:pimeloyl-ACP methyl ester carboxylesterase
MTHPFVVGRGPIPVLVLHGWFGSAQAWKPVFDVLDGDRFSYAFVDYRGYGTRLQESGTYTIDEIARDALDVADKLGWDRFSLIGHSMGGKAIQRVLTQAPQRVIRMVAITPVPASGVPFDDAGWQLFSGAVDSLEMRRDIIAFSTGGRLSGHWAMQMARQSAQQSTREAFGAYLPSWARGDFSAEVAGNPVPVKVIIGENDPSLTEAVMQATWLASYPNASLEVIANAGHYPMDETPVALATAIESFLAAAV